MLLDDVNKAKLTETLGSGAVLFDTEFERGEVVLERVERVVSTAQTQFQRVDIVETAAYGRSLLLDGALQSTAADERSYHEMLIHPALVTIEQPREVLIIGGGEGATLREVLRHHTIRRAVMVDIDGELVEICKRDLHVMHQGAFDDPRVEVRIQDGAEFLKASPGQFDLIVYDLTDPGTELPGPLLHESFLRLAKSSLVPDGMLVMNPFRIGVHGLSPLSLRVRATLQNLFANVELYAAYIHSFLWYCGFLLASDTRLAAGLPARDVDARLRARGVDDLYCYDGITHQALFALPRWVRRELR
jgi:spermidine synthase